MYRQLMLLLALVLPCFPCYAQTDNASILLKTVASDCDQAIPIKLFRKTQYGPTFPPNGFGNKQEIIATSRNSNIAFEKEHNSAWYLLSIYFDGEIIFDIIPRDSSNDYDFILYRYPDSNFCQSLAAHKAEVVRSNIRRNDTNTKGVTGLARDAENKLQAQGPGAQYSRSLPVKKGDKYMLVLDNVYPDGKGHTLIFHYTKAVVISGTVANDEGKKLAAEVTLSDPEGNTIATTVADDSGQYTIRINLHEREDYQLTFTDNNSFTDIQTINTNQLKNKDTFLNIRTVLPKLKKGGKYRMGNINFYGSSSRLLPKSYPSVQNLYKLMKKNPGIKIQIEGHVDGPDMGTNAEFQTLSEWRAKTVYDYLLDHGIAAERMSTIGLSNRFMLFPHALTKELRALNRRVEINIVSLEINKE